MNAVLFISLISSSGINVVTSPVFPAYPSCALSTVKIRFILSSHNFKSSLNNMSSGDLNPQIKLKFSASSLFSAKYSTTPLTGERPVPPATTVISLPL